MACIYDINGNIVSSDSITDTFAENIQIDYKFDDASSTNYQVFRINKRRIDGTAQFPFVRYKSTRTTALEIVKSEGWPFIINSGTGTGLVIENSVVIDDTTYAVESTEILPLSIDQNGNLGYLDANFIGKGQQYIANGIVSAVCGFFPIIDNYDDFDYPTFPEIEKASWIHAQRQIIGQFGNGDYMILTSEGRSFDNSVGFTMADAQRVCKTLGVKFAYNLDGGGSTQTVFGKRMINLVYEGTSGRTRSSFIVFNGMDQFSVPDVEST